MTRIAFLLSLLAATLVFAGEALACSCAIGDPRDMLERSDGAFVGTLVEREVVEDQALHTFSVERVLKGAIGGTVAVRSHRDGATCGLEVPIGQRVGLVLDREGGEWLSSLCQQVAPDELLAAAEPLPAPTGSGPLAFLVGGSFGDVRTVALDARGRTLAYGPGDGDVYLLAVCPGGERAVEVVRLPWESGGGIAVEVRDLRSMAIVARLGSAVEWTSSLPDYVGCEAADGSAAVVLARSEVAPERLLRLTEDEVEVLWRGEAVAASFAGGKAYVCAGAKGRRAIEVSLRTGKQRFLARVPAYTGELSPSPGGRYLAGVAYSSPVGSEQPPSRAVVIDTGVSPARVRTAALARANVSGEMLWLSPTRVVFAPTRGDVDRIRLYNASLRLLARGERLWAYDAAVRDGRLVALAAPFLVEGAPPTGTLTELGRLPGPVAYTLDAVPDGREVGAAAWRRSKP